jgi:hypothetical protein
MGRHRWTNRLTVEECPYWLDVEGFHRAGPALANALLVSGTMSWDRPDGEVLGTLKYSVIRNPVGVSICIPHQLIVRDGSIRLAEECLIPITTTRPYLGGRRFWFLCPALRDGTHCSRRVGRLYLPPGQQSFACRHCHGLSYETAQQHDPRKYNLARDPTALGAALRSKDRRHASLGIGALALLGKWSRDGRIRQLVRVSSLIS